MGVILGLKDIGLKLTVGMFQTNDSSIKIMFTVNVHLALPDRADTVNSKRTGLVFSLSPKVLVKVVIVLLAKLLQHVLIELFRFDVRA